MGLVKLNIESMQESSQDLIKCEDMDNDILMIKKIITNEQISQKSKIMVSSNQVAVLCDSGKVLDVVTNEGIYIIDDSSLSQISSFESPLDEKAIFYFNIKEITDNKFATLFPISFQDWSHPVLNPLTKNFVPMALKVRCYGNYTFKINQVDIFMRNYINDNIVTKDILLGQMDLEVNTIFEKILNELGSGIYKVPVLELTNNTDKMKQIINNNVFDTSIKRLGIKLTGFTIEFLSLDEESNLKISQYEINSNSSFYRM